MSSIQKSKQKDQSSRPVNKEAKEQKNQPKIKLAQMLEAPETLTQEDVVNAQQQLGNQVVQRALDNEDKRKAVTDNQGNLHPEISNEIQKKRGEGVPLPDSIRKDVEKNFKQDFGDVRLHTDKKADELSRTINARAFTIGKDIFFKDGVFEPGSSQGQETLHHELTHVVQQGGGKGRSGPLKLGSRDTAQEQEADRVGKQNRQNADTSGTLSQNSVQTMEEEDSLQLQLEERGELQMQEDDLDEDLSEMEEDEVQAQEEDMVEEEDEIQAQEEDMDEEEDEVQAQEEDMDEEEEEVQAQPDVIGVVQRDLEDDLKKQKAKLKPVEERVLPPKPQTETQSPLMKQFMEKRKKMMPKEGELSESQKKSFAKLERQRKTAFKKSFGAEVDPIGDSREKLINKIKDPKSSAEDVKDAEEKLRTLHKGKWYQKNVATGALSDRKKALKLAAQKGDDEAFQKLKSEKKPSKFSKTGGFLKKWGKRFLGKTGSDLKEHFFGKETKTEAPKKEEKPSPSPVTVNVEGGGGNGKMMEIMEKYADLKVENKTLKDKLGIKDED